MKPRRLLSAVDHMPTIMELQENMSQVYSTQSLDDYMDSIRELSQPAYPLSGPLQGSRLPAPRMAKYPSVMSGASNPVLAYRAFAPIGPDNVSFTLTLRSDSRTPGCPNQDPLDWLFTQAQDGGSSLTESAAADEVCMI